MGSRATTNLIGHVTAAPKCDEYQPGKWLARFTIAVNRRRGEKDEVDYFRCIGFGLLAETVRKHVSKGRLISWDCEPQQHRWEKDDEKREDVSFVGQKLLFLDSKPTEGTAAVSGPSTAYSEGTEAYDPGGDAPPF
jgi:single-stranded DNA-binding protein